MFGYIITNPNELKIKDYQVYRSFYCGLCQSLKREHGWLGQCSISYDLTFVFILLTALYEQRCNKKECTCIAHPFKKHCALTNPLSVYCADINLLLTYYKCTDDWKDEKKISRLFYSLLLKNKIKKLNQKYPEKSFLIKENLHAIHACEKRNERDLDLVSGFFGKLMADILAFKNDEWTDTLREMGFYLGKFIYLMDAYDDINHDLKEENYNPFLFIYHSSEFEEQANKILTMMISKCCRAFERLPILCYTDILRNILYSGIWTRYNDIKFEKEEQNHV